MKTALSIAQIVEAIESLTSEEQAVLFERLDLKKQKKQIFSSQCPFYSA
jgi:hypothetical protein